MSYAVANQSEAYTHCRFGMQAADNIRKGVEEWNPKDDPHAQVCLALARHIPKYVVFPVRFFLLHRG